MVPPTSLYLQIMSWRINGKCKVFNPYKDQLHKLTGLEVKMAPEHHDC